MAAITAPAQADSTVAAKEKYESGVRHFDLAEYESALADFKEAYRNKPDPVFLYNIGQCHRKLGHTDEAINFYQTYLRRAPDAKNREEVERRIAELQTLHDAAKPSSAPMPGPSAVPAPPTAAAPEPAGTPSAPASAPIALAPSMPSAQPTPTASTSPALDLSSHHEAAPVADGAFYKRWWFWTAVGVVAAGVATVAIIKKAERDPTKIPTTNLGSQRALP